MRVLQVVHGFPPRSTAGVEVYTARLSAALAARGHEVGVLAAAHDLSARSGTRRRRRIGEVEVAEIVNVRERGGLEASYADPEVGRACEAVIAERRPEIVHVQHLLNLSVELVHEARRLGAAVLLTLHDYWLSCPRDGLRRRADGVVCESVDHAVCAACLGDSPYLAPGLQRGLLGLARGAGLGSLVHRLHDAAPRTAGRALRALRVLGGHDPASLQIALDERAVRLRKATGQLDAVVAPTAFAASRAVEFGVDPQRLRQVAHGVSLPRVSRAGPRRRFGYVGGLAEHKGVHVLVEAFRGMGRPDVSLAIHGNPATHPEYAARLDRLAEGDSRIHLAGPFAEGDQAEVMRELDVVVLPSLWWENSPFTLLEARASGAWVVASRTGGVPELLPEGAGHLVPPGEVGALRAALDAAAAGTVGAHAPAPRSMEVETLELEALYEELLRKRARR